MGRFERFLENLPQDFSGKTIAITGTTSGTGLVAAQTMAELGAEVILLNRPSSRAESALAKLKASVPAASFVSIACDLQDFDSVRTASSEVNRRFERLYALVMNAGVMALADKPTKDGFDVTMQTNHLGHFLLCSELFPLIKAGCREYGDARIVTVSSYVRHGGSPNKELEEKYFRPTNGGSLGGDSLTQKNERYVKSKLANAVFAYALHEKLRAASSGDDEGLAGIRSMTCQPGFARTNISSNMMNPFVKAMITPLAYWFTQSAEEGAMGALKCTLDPDAESGAFYGPKNDAMKGNPVSIPKQAHESDPASYEMLWKTSEEATGVKFIV